MIRPMRILFTLPNFITAGSGRAMLNLVERLDRDRFAPGVAIERAGGAMDREVEAMGIPFVVAPFRVPAFPRATFPARAWRAARPFRGFDAWHSFNWQSEYSEAVIARLSGARSWIFTKKNMNWDRRSWHVRATLATRIDDAEKRLEVRRQGLLRQYTQMETMITQVQSQGNWLTQQIASLQGAA